MVQYSVGLEMVSRWFRWSSHFVSDVGWLIPGNWFVYFPVGGFKASGLRSRHEMTRSWFRWVVHVSDGAVVADRGFSPRSFWGSSGARMGMAGRGCFEVEKMVFRVASCCNVSSMGQGVWGSRSVSNSFNAIYRVLALVILRLVGFEDIALS